MKVEYLFSRNKKFGSKLISWASGLLIKDLDKLPSHVAVLLDDYLVMESTFNTGVRCIPYSCWKNINEECYRIPCSKVKINPEEISLAYESVFGKGYDWLGILYFSWCFLKHLVIKTTFPKNNRWENKNRFFCTEFAGRLSGYNKYSMTTPAKMCSDFLKGRNDVNK